MATAYDILGIGPDATRAELEAAYLAKSAAYDPARVAEFPEEFVKLAAQRRADLMNAYQSLRTALAAPPRLAPAQERQRDRETIVALLILVMIALLAPLVRGIAVPERTVTALGADAAALASNVAPSFTLKDLDGQDVSLADFQGQVVVLNFWATWCPPCVREIPRLVRISEQYRDQGLVVLGINTTYQDDPVKVAQFAHDRGISYPVLLDQANEAGRKYPARLMPTTYLIDHTGKIVHTKVGEVDETTLKEQIRTLLQARDGGS